MTTISFSLKSRPPRTVTDALAAVPLFSACTPKELREIAALGTRLIVPARMHLTGEGQAGQEFFLLLSGEVSCRIGESEIAHFGPGEFFGEMSLLDGDGRSAELVTVADTTLMVLDPREFAALLHTSPAIALKMLAVLATRLRRVNASLHH